MNKREGGTIHPHSTYSSFFFVFFPFPSFPPSLIPSSDKESKCLGKQRKPQPFLHLLGTRNWYVNNDRQPTPLSFTAATERMYFFSFFLTPSLTWALPALNSDPCVRI